MTAGPWFGPVQHTYTQLCDGNHPPGPCPVPTANTATSTWPISNGGNGGWRLSDEDVRRVAKQVIAELAKRARLQ